MVFFSRRYLAWLLRLFPGLLLLAGGTSGITAVLASDSNTATPPLNLSQALSRILHDSPELAVFPLHLRAAEARAVQAGLRPNPELSLVVENFAGDSEFSGTDSAEVTLALSQVVELGGKRGFRRDVARWESDVLQRDYEIQRLDVLAKGTHRFLDVALLQELLMLVEHAASWAKTAEHAVQARNKAGSAGRAELSQARIEALRAGLAVSEVQTNLDTARRALAGQWGAEQADFNRVNADIFRLVNVPAFAQLREQLEQSPQLQRYLTLDRLRQAELDLAIAQGKQNVSIGLGVRRFEGTGDQALMMQFSMPLGFGNRNQGNVAAARADLERLGSERRASRIVLYNELYRLYQQLQQTRRSVEVLRGQAMTEAEQASIQIEQGYRRGRFSYLELLEVRRQYLAVAREAIDAAVAFHRALLTLEQLTGESLTQSTRSVMPAGDQLPESIQD
jgi:cobalt-zinc-cadmium efflux system outer membrane protein